MKLKSVIHYAPTNSVEATWVNVITPAYDVPESVAPDTEDKDGNVIPGAVTPAHTVPAVEVNVKCHSYHETQMNWLEADLGADAADYADLIALVRSNIVPYVPPPPEVPASVTRRQGKQALLMAGLLSNVQPAIDAISDPIQRGLIQIEWDDSQIFERHRPSVIGLAAAIGLTTPKQVDALFIAADKLP